MPECYTYTQWSICVAPASSTVWFVPVLSSDTGTWLSLHWFAAGGAPTDEAWHWRRPPPDTNRVGRQTDMDFIHLCFSRGACCETHVAAFQRRRAQHSHSYIHSHPVGSRCDCSGVLSDTERLCWSSWGLSGILEAAAEKIYILCLSLSISLFHKAHTAPSAEYIKVETPKKLLQFSEFHYKFCQVLGIIII